MHYRAKKSISSDGWSVVSCIPTFLLINTDDYGLEELVRFMKIMESEIARGNSFDTTFLKDCRYYATDWSSPYFGSPKEEVELLTMWLNKLDNPEDQNIINTHHNLSKKTARLNLAHKTPFKRFHALSNGLDAE